MSMAVLIYDCITNPYQILVFFTAMFIIMNEVFHDRVRKISEQ